MFLKTGTLFKNMDEFVEIKSTIEPSEKMIRTTVKHTTETVHETYDWSVQVASWDDLKKGVSSHGNEAKDDDTVWKTSVCLTMKNGGRDSLEIGGQYGIGGDKKYTVTVRTYLARPDGVIVSASSRYYDNHLLDIVQDGWIFPKNSLDNEFPEKSFIIRYVVDGTVTTKTEVREPLIE